MREVHGGFVNLAGLDVPHSVRCFISCGLKTMIPSFTLVRGAERRSEWSNMIAQLEKACYFPKQDHDA